MEKPDLSQYGIRNVKELYYNLSHEELFKHETQAGLKGLEKGFVTNTGAVAVDTGIFTGRSPKDKYVVFEETSANNLWWAKPGENRSDNKPISEAIWSSLKKTSLKQLHGKKLYVMDAFCGTNPASRMKIRVITEVAWMAHFVKNMFIRPSAKELKNFDPDFVMFNACKTVNEQWEEQQLNSDVYVAFNLKERAALIGGTWYGGEIKKGMFSVMNYYLPLKGMASMHCSANMGKNGDTAIFFGLSGTGKTTLSTAPDRYLIGDDEHGWDDEGVFNFEGGCYAKCINLNKEKEPEIYAAIRRDALLENVVYDPDTGEINFFDTSKTENTRVSYPIYHIENIVKPVSKGGHPRKVIFLTADAFGVLPPVSKLTMDQAMYYFLSGYTSKLAGTERGVKEPMPTFSAAFGAAFLMLHPTVYAQELIRKMKQSGTTAYLVNTGWIGGPYGIGKRIDLETTRQIVRAILSGSLDHVECEELMPFGLMVPKHVEGVDPNILNQKNTWKYETAYEKQAGMLADKFIENFQQFTNTEEGQRLVAAGPQNLFMKQYYRYYDRKIEKLEKRHAKEINRLKDQIYILQHSFNEYISFNSINSSYKKRPLIRYVPVNTFFDSQDEKVLGNCQNILFELMEEIGFKVCGQVEEEDGVREYMTRSAEELTNWQVYDRIAQLAECFRRSPGDNQEMATLKKQLEKTSQPVRRFAVKIGPVLIMKTGREAGDTGILVRKMSVSGLIHLDKHPGLLTAPGHLLEELNGF